MQLCRFVYFYIFKFKKNCSGFIVQFIVNLLEILFTYFYCIKLTSIIVTFYTVKLPLYEISCLTGNKNKMCIVTDSSSQANTSDIMRHLLFHKQCD